ncbi:hypothetical protein [Pseudanabaena mucicola]|nr:hypothetical protein [Pseudanabaena mucicola]
MANQNSRDALRREAAQRISYIGKAVHSQETYRETLLDGFILGNV